MGGDATNSALKDLFLEGTEGLVASDSSKPTIKRLNFNHESIIRWLLANPGKVDGATLQRCADHFGYSRAWLSIIIHSDAFKARWRELADEADAAVLADIPAKVRGAASVAVEALAEQIATAAKDQTVAPRDFLLKSSEMLLKSLGYGQGKNITVNNNAPGAQTNFVEADALSRARSKLTAPRPNGSEPKLIGSGTPETTP